jgi:nicotinate-nucleotide--dimethylbenzimidazole phosphoribosyltransferase
MTQPPAPTAQPDQPASIEIPLPDSASADQALARQATLTKPTGALGRLEQISVWAAAVQGQCPPQTFSHVQLTIFAGDHGVARTAQTSAYPPEVTAQMVLNLVTGGAAASVLARNQSVHLDVVDMAVDADFNYVESLDPQFRPDVANTRVRRSSGSIDREDALTTEQAEQALLIGRRCADRAIDAGADLLIAGDMGIGNTTPAAAIIGLLTRSDAAQVTGRGTGIDDATWMRKCTAVREAMRRARPVMGNHTALLACIAGADIAAMVGYLLRGAERGVPTILDGTVVTAAALVVDRQHHRARKWWLAGHQSTEPAHQQALEFLDLIPVVDLSMRLGEGTGALMALATVQSAISLLAEMATFDEAAVTNR